jgi:signal transduction histidine kinase
MSSDRTIFSAVRNDTEFEQTIVRFGIGTLVLLYMVFAKPELNFPLGYFYKNNIGLALLIAYIGATCMSIWVYFRPGINTVRRVIAMLFDYGFLGSFLLAGGETHLPIFAALVWVSVGNGIRYGRAMLMAALAISMVTVAIVWYLNPYWFGRPFLSGALAIIAFVVPTYSLALLQKLQVATQAAATANIQKSRFLAQASHDLRHPLHAVDMIAARLLKTGLTDDQRALVEKIDQSALSAKAMLNAFLDVSIIETGHLKPQITSVAVGAALADVHSALEVTAQYAGVRVITLPSRLHVKTDPMILQTMVQNLASNAIKYAPGAKIVIGAKRKAGAVWIEVHDNGPGMSGLEEMGIAPNPITPKSAGLGLSIVGQLAAITGTRLDLHSHTGRGTTARIGPFEVAEPAARPLPQVQRSALTGMKIALLNIDPVPASHIIKSATEWGCEVSVTEGNDLADAHQTVLFSGDISDVAQRACYRSVVIVTDAAGGYGDHLNGHIMHLPIDRAELRSILMAITVAAQPPHAKL